MKIICTKEEQDLLDIGADLCLVIKHNGKCIYARDGHCNNCYKENINWEIIDGQS